MGSLAVVYGWLQLEQNKRNNKQKEKLMAAINDLNASIDKLTVAVDAAVKAILTPHPTDADVLAASARVDAQTARLNDATTPPPAV